MDLFLFQIMMTLGHNHQEVVNSYMIEGICKELNKKVNVREFVYLLKRTKLL